MDGLGRNTQHSHFKGGELYFGSCFLEVSVHSQLAPRQGCMHRDIGDNSYSPPGDKGTQENQARTGRKIDPSRPHPQRSLLQTRAPLLTASQLLDLQSEISGV